MIHVGFVLFLLWLLSAFNCSHVAAYFISLIYLYLVILIISVIIFFIFIFLLFLTSNFFCVKLCVVDHQITVFNES